MLVFGYWLNSVKELGHIGLEKKKKKKEGVMMKQKLNIKLKTLG